MLPSDTQCVATPPPSPVYDRDYFIAKFEAIPAERFTTAAYHRGRASCWLGHCGADYGPDKQTGKFGTVHTAESAALVALFSGMTEVMAINDGHAPSAVAHLPTPKERILAALRALPAS